MGVRVIRAPASDTDGYAFQHDTTFFEEHPRVVAFVRKCTPVPAEIARCTDALRPFGDALRVAVVRVEPGTHVRIPLVNAEALNLALAIARETLE
jgi:hypothetical protein